MHIIHDLGVLELFLDEKVLAESPTKELITYFHKDKKIIELTLNPFEVDAGLGLKVESQWLEYHDHCNKTVEHSINASSSALAPGCFSDQVNQNHIAKERRTRPSTEMYQEITPYAAC